MMTRLLNEDECSDDISFAQICPDGSSVSSINCLARRIFTTLLMLRNMPPFIMTVKFLGLGVILGMARNRPHALDHKHMLKKVDQVMLLELLIKWIYIKKNLQNYKCEVCERS